MDTEKQDLHKKFEDQYNIARPLNNDLITHNFHNSQNAYSPHALFDTTGQLKYVFDHTVSIIDAKTARIAKDNKNIEFIIKGLSNIPNIAEKIQNIGRKLIENLNQKNDTSIIRMRPLLVGFERRNLSRNKNILKKLYNDTIIYKESFWEELRENTLTMTKTGREYFSTILGEFYCYNESNNFLSKNRKENLFPNNIYLSIREKFKDKQLLTDDEICEFIYYLLQKGEKDINETEEEKMKRHHSDTAKSHLINILYGMMHAEQKYNYNRMSKINEGLFNMTKFDEKLSNELDIKKEDIYTEIRQKNLSSLAFKEIRGETSTDLIGSRSWVSDELLEELKNKHLIVEKCFNEAKDNLITFYNSKGYTLICDSFDVANKFKKGNITFDQKNIKTIESKIKKQIGDENKILKSDNNTHVRDVYNYDIIGISNSNISEKEKNIIQKALDNDNSKTGGNGEYSDIKFRMTFHLINNNDPYDVIYNQSYEHMIVNMNSSNEGGLSDHNIFLDSVKNIPLKLRISTALDTGIFMDSVCGGIDKTIKELAKLKSYLDDSSIKPNNMPLQYIKKQYDQRRLIPKEILEIAGLQYPFTYLALDKDCKNKAKVENAIAEYLLVDQFEKGRLHRFIYDNDYVEGLTDDLHRELRDNKNISYEYSGHDDFIKKALQEKNTGKYCLCGGGSNNLAKSCNSKLFSDKAYIGVVDPLKNVINFFTTPVFAGIVAEGTHIKNPDIILGDIKTIFKQQKSSFRSAK